MKPTIIKTAALVGLLAAGLMSSRGQQFGANDFSFLVTNTVPDGNLSGLANNQPLAGMSGIITNISVTLNISNAPGDTAFNGDLYAYLRHGSTMVVLLNRTGLTGTNSDGYDDTGFNVTFTTSASNNIHFYQNLDYSLNGDGQLTGDWQPDGRAMDPLSLPSLFDSTSPTSSLTAFSGTDPNGTWTLFIADMENGATSQLMSWDLQITTVPEPPVWALLILGALQLFRQLRIGKRPRA